MDLGLAGRTAIVCGASSGLGLASAQALVAEGADVAILGRRRELLEREAEQIGALAVPGDVTSPDDLERIVQTTLETFGGVDIVVWNSGGPPAGKAVDLTAEAVQQAVDLLLLPAVRLVGLCLPHLGEAQSVAVLEPTSHLALSNIVRPGVTGWAKTLANELGPKGITVNCVAPGRIDTARLAELYPAGPTRDELEEIPLRRWGTPQEFGDVVCFLASDRARYVTGQTLAVDGGLTRGLL